MMASQFILGLCWCLCLCEYIHQHTRVVPIYSCYTWEYISKSIRFVSYICILRYCITKAFPRTGLLPVSNIADFIVACFDTCRASSGKIPGIITSAFCMGNGRPNTLHFILVGHFMAPKSSNNFFLRAYVHIIPVIVHYIPFIQEVFYMIAHRQGKNKFVLPDLAPPPLPLHLVHHVFPAAAGFFHGLS